MRDNTIFKFGISFFTGLFAFTGLSLAQVDEITVTATKRETALVDTPVSVSVTSGAVLERAQINDVNELQYSVPSLKITQNYAVSQNTFYIRGFGNGANNPGVEPSVSIIVDGVSRTRNQSAMGDLISIEQIEVVRGPQTTLFGRSASAGVINISTKLPEEEFGGKVTVTGGSDSLRKLSGTMTGPLSDDTFFRLSASSNTRDGFVTNSVTGSDVNERDRYAVRGQILSNLSDELTMRIIADFDNVEELCCDVAYLTSGLVDGAFVAAGLADRRETLGGYDREFRQNFDPENKLEGRGISAQFDLDMGFATLTSLSSYRENEHYSKTDVDFGVVDVLIQEVDDEYETFTQELRLVSDDSQRLRWIAGLYYLDEDLTHDRSVKYRSTLGVRSAVDTLLAGQGSSLAAISQLYAQGVVAGVAALPSATQIAAGFPSPVDATRGAFTTAAGVPLGAAAFADPTTAAIAAGTVTALATGYLADDITSTSAWFVGGQGLQSEAFDVNTETLRLYANFDYDITDALTASVGIAYIEDQKTVVSNVVINDPFAALPLASSPATVGLTAVQFFPPFLNYPNDIEDGVFDSDDITTSAKLVWALDDDTNVYASYSTGYKPTSVSVSADASVYAGQTYPASIYRALPEEVTLYELGYKTQFDNGYLNFTVFRQSIENFQSNLFVGTGFNLANAEEQENVGIEIDSMLFLSEDFFATFAAQYIDAEYKEHSFGPCDRTRSGDPSDDCNPGEFYSSLTGETPGGIPELSFSVSGNYRFDLSNSTEGFFRVEYYFEEEHQATEVVPESIASREVSTINASLNFTNKDNGLSVSIWGRNINDDEHLQTAFQVPGSDSVAAYPASPAFYGITIGKEF